MSCPTKNNGYSHTKRASVRVSIMRKPSRRTLLRIRYYEFKIRMAELWTSFVESLRRISFRQLLSSLRHQAEERENSNLRRDESESTIATENQETSTFSVTDTSVVEPGEIRDRTVEKPKCTRKRTDVSTRKGRRKQRSSLTRRKLDKQDRSTSKKSFESGDMGNSDRDNEKNRATEIRRERHRQSKLNKSVQAVMSCASVCAEDPQNVMPCPADETEKTDDISSNPQPSVPLPQGYAPGHVQSGFHHPSHTIPPSGPTSDKTIWERLVALTNRKRPTNTAEPKLVRFGFKMGLPQGKLRRTPTLSRNTSAVSQLNPDGYERRDFSTLPLASSQYQYSPMSLSKTCHSPAGNVNPPEMDAISYKPKTEFTAQFYTLLKDI